MPILRMAGLLLLLLALAGCSSTATVRGTVTLDDKPVEDGSIKFESVDGSTSTAGGDIKNGRYSVPVPICKMKVSIYWSKVVGTTPLYDTPDSPTRPVTAPMIPKKYNEETTLEFDVVPGVNEKDWALRSQ